MNEQIVVLLIGAVSPPIIDLVNRYVTDSKWRFVVALVFSAVLGIGYSLIVNGVEASLADATLIFAASQTVYKLIYAESKVQERIIGD
jgi:hypothetical protein